MEWVKASLSVVDIKKLEESWSPLMACIKECSVLPYASPRLHFLLLETLHVYVSSVSLPEGKKEMRELQDIASKVNNI